MRIAPLGLRNGDREKLVSLTRSSTIMAGSAQRARIVLLAAEGVSNTEIALRTGVSHPTVITWRARYERSGAVCGRTVAFNHLTGPGLCVPQSRLT